jgi:hypothetical protein
MDRIESAQRVYGSQLASHTFVKFEPSEALPLPIESLYDPAMIRLFQTTFTMAPGKRRYSFSVRHPARQHDIDCVHPLPHPIRVLFLDKQLHKAAGVEI